MPIRIVKEHSRLFKSGFVMTETEFRAAMTHFTDHYSVKNGSGGTNSFPTSTIRVEWGAFLNAINVGVNPGSGIDMMTVALVFTHRYFIGTNVWGLNMDCYQVPSPIASGTASPNYSLTGFPNSPIARFELTDLSVTQVATPTAYTLDPDYFGKVAYDGGDLDDSAQGHVRSLTFPLCYEVMQLYTDNQLVFTDDNKVRLVIASCSIDCSSDPTYSNVPWPHGLAMYFQKDNNTGSGFEDLLSDMSFVSIFKYKAADYSTLCPPACATYTRPSP